MKTLFNIILCISLALFSNCKANPDELFLKMLEEGMRMHDD